MSIGADPAYVKWDVVRGDTSVIRLEFYEIGEKEFYDTTNWTYDSTVYDRKGNALTSLDTEVSEGYVDITATSQVTSTWGRAGTGVVDQLDFDVRVTLADGEVWTPLIGIISVIGSLTGS